MLDDAVQAIESLKKVELLVVCEECNDSEKRHSKMTKSVKVPGKYMSSNSDARESDLNSSVHSSRERRKSLSHPIFQTLLVDQDKIIGDQDPVRRISLESESTSATESKRQL